MANTPIKQRVSSPMVEAKEPEVNEEASGVGARAVHVSARSCQVVARTLPVSEFVFTQLGPGRFEIDSATAFADEVSLTRMHVGPLAAGTVVPDPAYVAFLLPLRSKSRYLFNGVQTTPSSLCIAGGRNGYHTHGASRESIAVGLPRSRLTATIAALRGVGPDEIRLDDRVLSLPPPFAARLRERLAAIIATGSGARSWADSEQGRHNIKSEVYQLLIDAYLDAQASADGDARRAMRQIDIVRRAEERFIAAGSQPISLADLCASAGVGRTTLQQAFNDLYGESPLGYFRKRRLTQAREALVLARTGRAAVKRAALEAGLTALGRFSVEYRRLFGESPSATLSEPSA